MLRRSFLAASAAMPFAGCATPRTPVLAGPASLTPLKSYSQAQCALLMKLAGVKGAPSRNGVDCYRVDYGSRDSSGRPIRLSGLLALPHEASARGLISWQHGTTTDRTQVPSTAQGDGLAAAIVFAGAGYAMAAADYLGLGASPLVHTYYAVDDTARAVVDLLDAVKGTPGVPDAAPILVGFSQGAHASMAALQALEAAGRPVLGAAPISGAYHLRTLSLDATFTRGAVQASVYLTYLTRGMAARYGQTLESALAPEVAAIVPTLYDTPHKPSEVVAALPKTPRATFGPAFLEAYDHGGRHWLLDALEANSLAHLTPKAPVRMFYGEKDLDVSPQESIVTAAAFRARGADAAAISVGPVDHEGSIIAGGPAAFRWIETLGAGK